MFESVMCINNIPLRDPETKRGKLTLGGAERSARSEEIFDRPTVCD